MTGEKKLSKRGLCSRLPILIFTSFALLQSCSVKEEQQQSKQVVSPASKNSAEPNLIEGADGNLYLSWVERSDEKAILKYSKWRNTQWSTPEMIAEGNDWFVNWADYPAMAVNKSGDKIAHYLQMSDTGTYTYDIKVVGKKSGASKWSIPIKLHRDSVNAEHGFVTMIPMDDGHFFLAWLDGRNTASMDMEGHDHSDHGGGAMTVRSAILSSDLEISEEAELDTRVCDCCQTTAAITSNGPVVGYRDRSEDEVRDMFIVRWVNGVWTAPKAIHNDNWLIEGCPVNGPKSVADGSRLAIAWFTAADDTSKVNLALSTNSGETFGKPIRLDEGEPIGRVDIDMIDSETVLVSWMEGSDIVAAQVSNNGNIIKRYQLTSSSDSRSSGFPQIALTGDQIMLAWTDSEEKMVKTKLISL